MLKSPVIHCRLGEFYEWPGNPGWNGRESRRLEPCDEIGVPFRRGRLHGQSNALARNVQVSLLAQQQFEIGKTPLPNIPKSAESGIGDEAYFTNTPGVGYILSVKKGSTYFRFQARAIPGFSRKKGSDAEEYAVDEKFKTVERAIASDILKRL